MRDGPHKAEAPTQLEMVEPLADRVLALTLADEPGQLAALLLDRPRWEGPLDVEAAFGGRPKRANHHRGIAPPMALVRWAAEWVALWTGGQKGCASNRPTVFLPGYPGLPNTAWSAAARG